MTVIKKYVLFDFYEFYNLVKDYLNEDIWYKIYKMSIPRFKKNDLCELKHNYYWINKIEFENIRIQQHYFNSKYNVYVYSYLVRTPFTPHIWCH